jgi:hypothetical protein
MQWFAKSAAKSLMVARDLSIAAKNVIKRREMRGEVPNIHATACFAAKSL